LDYGQYYDLAVALSDGPRTVEEIKSYYKSYLRLLGLFTSFNPFSFDKKEWSKEIESALEALIERGWAVREGERYTLSPLGKEEAARAVRRPLCTLVRSTRRHLEDGDRKRLRARIDGVLRELHATAHRLRTAASPGQPPS